MTDTPYYPPLPFHPLVADGLRELLEVWPREVRPADIPELRRVTDEFFPSLEDYIGGHDLDLEEIRIPGPADAPDVVLAVYMPRKLHSSAPCLYFIHSGGLVSGTRYSDELQLLSMAMDLGAVAVSVEYRLAPEHPYPAAIDDCLSGFDWVTGHADEIGIDPGKIILIGESAGGGLAAALSFRIRDRGGPAPLGQLLATPMLDDRNASPSVFQMDGVGCWDKVSNETGWRALLGDSQGGPDTPPDASPARATDLAGLPATFIDVGSSEIFRDECVDFASRLWLAGVQTELHVWPGGCHIYYSVAPDADISLATYGTRLSWIRRTLQGS